jgi:hypothetical protein
MYQAVFRVFHPLSHHLHHSAGGKFRELDPELSTPMQFTVCMSMPAQLHCFSNMALGSLPSKMKVQITFVVTVLKVLH